MKILFASRYVDPLSSGGNKNVYLQAKSLKDDFNIDIQILTWPTNDLWSGLVPKGEKQCPPIRSEIDGLIYHLFTAPSTWDVTAGGSVLSDKDWAEAVQYGMRILERLQPDIVHLQHRHGLWWILESAQRLGLPTIYTNHDWGLACMRTVLVMGDGSLCDGSVAPRKCAQCVKEGRASVLGRANEALVSNYFGESLANLALNIPILHTILKKKGAVTEPAIQRATTNYRRATSVLSRLAHCFTPSRFGAKYYSQLGCPEDRISVLPWYHDPVNSKKVVRSEQPFTITYIGRVSPEKGVDLIFSAFEKLTDVEAVTLRIAGANDSIYCTQLREKHPANIGIHSVEWLGWCAVEPLFQRTDAAIIPSVLMDNTPLSLIESLAYRVPVIATRVPPIEEMLVEGETGFLADFRSVDSLANAIRRAILKKGEIRAEKLSFPPVLGIKGYMAEVVRVYQGIVAETTLG